MEQYSRHFWDTLLNWSKSNTRCFPWRVSRDPYHVMIAEFLLQQTHVRAVPETYRSLIARYPTVGDLSWASSDDVKQTIQPLGLSYRADRLICCARSITGVFDGIVPNSYDDLRSLNGIGDYIANAILCYAYHQPTVPIDTNVIRLFSRYFGLHSNKARPRTDKGLALEIRQLFPKKVTREFNLAVLDFAGQICTARRPLCNDCPLAPNCRHTIQALSSGHV